MGTLLAVFSEKEQTFFSCQAKLPLNTDGVRRVRASPYRYCLGAHYLYVPSAEMSDDDDRRFCWVRDRELFSIDALNEAYSSGDFDWADVRIGNTYTKRHREEDGRFVEVEQFVGQNLFEELAANPEALPDVSKEDFENLCAELFVRKGFEVDLFRSSKDGGIDFLAVGNEDTDPIVLAVQCKQPDKRKGKNRRALGRPVVQQIYGAAKAWDIEGAVAISGSTYSKEAASFAANKPDEIKLYDAEDILSWIRNYRWNDDE